MDTRYGKLILLDPNGPEQEFILAKATVSLGRATTNDITLNDVRVSRNHARLECRPQGITLIDLDSSNGTRLNGTQIDRATLVPGDTLSLGSQQLKYLVEDPLEDLGQTKIDTQAQLEKTINDEYLPVVINETSHPNLVVVTGERTWSLDLKNLDQVVIGRDENCDLFIDASNISRRHAEVQQRGEVFILNDLGSTNGTWIGGQQIDQHILQDGDTFRIGSTQIVFKRGFQEQTLTMLDDSLPLPEGRRTVVFVPGLMGSELWLGNERVWPNVKTLFTNPEIFSYPSDLPLEARSIVDEVVIVPNLIKQDQYNRLGDYLVDELQFTRDENYFDFPYDWRQDVRISANLLGEFIEKIESEHPIVIICHSLGTMVTRYYVENLGGDERIERLLLMGGVHQGAVKGLASVLISPQVLPFGIMGERLRQIIMTFPSTYQIIPNYQVGVDQFGEEINFLQESDWLDPKFLPLWRIGRDFRNELSSQAIVPSVSIFGYGIKTICNVKINRNEFGNLESFDLQHENIGDGSVLEQSAILPGSEIHPVHQHHGTLFIDNDVKMRLKMELLRPY